MRWQAWGWLVGLALCAACGDATGSSGTDSGMGSNTDVITSDSGAGGADASADAAPASEVGQPGQAQVTELNATIKVLAEPPDQFKTIKLNGVFIRPVDCTKTHKCPLAVIVGDYDSNAWPTFEVPATKLAEALGIHVVVFNLPGTGPGSKASPGTDDIGGLWHETAVKEVMHLKSKVESVDPTRTGFITIGTGLIPVARAITVYGTGALKQVAFLLDVEGPIDRCSISQAPENPSKGIGPADGPGATPSACNFTNFSPQSAMYPPAKDGKPASIVCAEGAWPITKTGEPCTANSWWSVREPGVSLKKIFQRYQRLQFKHDHRLPTHWASRIAIEKVAASQSRFFALNNMPPCETPLDDATCADVEAGGQSCWLQGGWGNGLSPAPYAGSELAPVSVDALFTQVLPGYVMRLLDETQFPNCK